MDLPEALRDRGPVRAQLTTRRTVRPLWQRLLRRATTPEAIHKHLYRLLGVASEIMKPVRALAA
ncbi:MAG TPA: hypothetical protein VMK12_29285 [Anaeromyxobacteraceae bacterium]|nr:hypothetical protein [Anaeromyxobacteraceae bacterium]